jgi:large subunit ribosomal protein L16
MLVNFFNPPVNLKFKKFQKNSTFNKTIKFSFSNSVVVTNVSFLKATSYGRLSLNHLESARKVIRRKMKKLGIFRTYVYPSVCITKKALAVRMGKGKGAIHEWLFPVRPGGIIFEITAASTQLSCEALLMASKKLPIHSKIITFA